MHLPYRIIFRAHGPAGVRVRQVSGETRLAALQDFVSWIVRHPDVARLTAHGVRITQVAGGYTVGYEGGDAVRCLTPHDLLHQLDRHKLAWTRVKADLDVFDAPPVFVPDDQLRCARQAVVLDYDELFSRMDRSLTG
jgi:hypothetical protein